MLVESTSSYFGHDYPSFERALNGLLVSMAVDMVAEDIDLLAHTIVPDGHGTGRMSDTSVQVTYSIRHTACEGAAKVTNFSLEGGLMIGYDPGKGGSLKSISTVDPLRIH
jgi:hypothetical protein